VEEGAGEQQRRGHTGGMRAVEADAIEPLTPPPL